jgi:hypothetical protein
MASLNPYPADRGKSRFSALRISALIAAIAVFCTVLKSVGTFSLREFPVEI